MTIIPQNDLRPLIGLISLVSLLGVALYARLNSAPYALIDGDACAQPQRVYAHAPARRASPTSAAVAPMARAAAPGAVLRHDSGWTWRGALPRVTPLYLPDQLVLFNHDDRCAGVLLVVAPQTGEVLWSRAVAPADAWCMSAAAPQPSLRYHRDDATLVLDWDAGPSRFASASYALAPRR